MKRRQAVSREDTEFIRLSVDEVYGGHVRGEEDDPELPVLAASIARHGLLQPIVVRQNEQRYELVCGARRVRAFKMLGKQYIDARLFRGDAVEAASCFVEENRTRVAPSFLDEARLLEQAEEECALPRTLTSRLLMVGRLDEQTSQAIRNAHLTLEQAEPLLQVPQKERRLEAAAIIAERALTPRQARRLVFPEKKDMHMLTGKRRAVREALDAIHALVEKLNAQGMCAGTRVLSQNCGLCIQIMLKTAESSEKMQEKKIESRTLKVD